MVVVRPLVPKGLNNVMYNYTFYHALYSVGKCFDFILRVTYSYACTADRLEPIAVSTSHTLLSLCCTVEQQHSDLGACFGLTFPLPDVSGSILPECMFTAVQVFC